MRADDELIVVDNCSTDGTREYLKELAKDSRVVVCLLTENTSITKSYNTGIKASSGEFIFIFDNDLEIVEPNTLDHMIQTFDVLEGDCRKIGIVAPHTNNIIGRQRSIIDSTHKCNRIENITMRRLRPYPILPSAAILILREAGEKVGWFDERYDGYGMLDLDFARSVIVAGYEIILDGFIFVKHYGSVTVSDYDIQPDLIRMRQLFDAKWNLPDTSGRPPRHWGR